MELRAEALGLRVESRGVWTIGVDSHSSGERKGQRKGQRKGLGGKGAMGLGRKAAAKASKGRSSTSLEHNIQPTFHSLCQIDLGFRV